MEYRNATISEITQALARQEVSAVEITKHALTAARKDEDSIHAYISFREERALADAAAADARRAAGQAGSLTGVPIALKDNLDIAGEPTTAGSKILETYQAVFSATVVTRLQAAGAVVIGKTNLDEFAMGSSTENSAFTPTRNPWNTEYVPGGSSGGSAATVAAGHVPAALGSDTGGSIRQPASFCGLVGMKPTYGRVSRYGLIALASSLDQIGPFTRSVRDAALVYDAIAGPDDRDATADQKPFQPISPTLTSDVRGLRIGLPKEFFGAGVDADIAAAITAAADVYRQRGATIVDVSIPHAPVALATYYVIQPAEASSNLARFDGIRYGHADRSAESLIERYAQSREQGFGAEVKRRIMMGTYVLSAGYADAYYRQAVRVRALLAEEFHRVFDEVDVLLTPTSPIKPFKVGDRASDPLQMYLADLLAVPANLAGIPAMSIPAGMSDGLPIGLQLLAKRWDEATMFRAALGFEEATEWHTMHPGDKR